MADKSIRIQDASTPLGYTVPSTSEIIPRAASAIIDGASATAAFYPVLEIVNDGGLVVAQSRATAVAAGGSAEVSWFPGVTAGTSAPTFTTASTPPSSPSDGDYWIYPVNESKGYYWMFQYDSGQATYPWLFVGGTPNTDGGSPNAIMDTLTEVGTTGTYWSNSAFTVPFDGDYMLGGGYVIGANGAGNNPAGIHLFINSALALGEHPYSTLITNTSYQSVTRSMQWMLGLTAGSTVGISTGSLVPATALVIYTDAQFVATRVKG